VAAIVVRARLELAEHGTAGPPRSVTGQHLVCVVCYFVLKFLSPILALKANNFTSSNADFYTKKLGVACSPEVTALLQFLAQEKYHATLLTTWMGNNRCATWLDVTCSV
jgi:hypothetical protein